MRVGAHTPIFKRKIRYGSVNVGASIGEEPAPPITITGSATPTQEDDVADGAGVRRSFTIIGSVTDALLDGVSAIVQDGNYAYLISAAQDRMTVCDVTDRTSPSVVGSYTSSTNIDNPQRIAKSGNYVYVASSNSDSLTSIDVSTPSSPTLGHKLTDATKLDGAVGVAISGTHAYVAAGGTAGRRLTVVDISNPLAMTIVGDTGAASLTDFGSARDVAVSGSYAYVCSNASDRITVVDISNPASPSVVANATDATKLDGANYVIKDGNYLYVAAQNLGYMTIVDVITPTSPVIKDGEQFGERQICKIGDIVFTSNAGTEIDALDVSDVNNIIDTGDFISSSTFLNGVAGLVTDGTFIYASAAVADRLTILVYA